MRAQSLSERTITERARVAAAICRDLKTTPETISTDQIAKWVSGLPSSVTKWCYFTHLRALFRWMEISGRRSDNPLLGMHAPKRPKYQPRPIPVEYISAVLELPLRKNTRCQILLAFNCGLRISEIAKIQGQDVDLLTRQMTVEGKGGQTAVIPVFATMPRHGYWFPAPTGGHVEPKSVGQTIKRAFERIGVNIRAHQLRHSYGTELLRHGADIRVVQELLRHESIQTTALYTRVTHDQEASATNLLPVFTMNTTSNDDDTSTVGSARTASTASTQRKEHIL